MKNISGLKFHVVVDGSNAAQFRQNLSTFIEINAVPSAYQPKKAKFKARALEWFRLNMELSDDDWVLHLDEESEIDEYVVKTCLDFIERGDEDIGMVSRLHFMTQQGFHMLT